MKNTFIKFLQATLLMLVVFNIGLQGQTAPTKQWSQGDPTGEEQEALEYINRIRKDMIGEGDRILALRNRDDVITALLRGYAGTTTGTASAQADAGAARVKTFISSNYNNNLNTATNGQRVSKAPLVLYPFFMDQALIAQTSVPGSPFLQNGYSFPTYNASRTPPSYLYPSAIAIATPSSSSGIYTGKNATGGTTTTARAFAAGTIDWMNMVWANVPEAKVITMRALFLAQIAARAPNYITSSVYYPAEFTALNGNSRMIGVNVSNRANGFKTLATFTLVQEIFDQTDLPFGKTNTVFITGVVWKDANDNGEYDAGEGLGGVAITPNNGDWYATTSTSGGFAIPVSMNSGSYTITAKGNGVDATGTVSVSGDNVKIDFTLPPDIRPLPAQVLVAPPDGTTQITGLSSRGIVEPGATALIGGFVITGPSNVKKKLLIRAVGRTLNKFGITDFSDRPTLTIYNGNTILDQNDDWTKNRAEVTPATAQMGLFALDEPILRVDANGNIFSQAGDSALVISVIPGQYSALVAPNSLANRKSAIGLIEIYDLTPNDGSRLISISTRGKIEEGARQMVVGVTVSGSGNSRLLIRASGPALTAFGVPGALENPNLTIYRDQTVLTENADWSFSNQTNQIRNLGVATGAFAWAEGSNDAASIIRVSPGSYTAVTGGAPNTVKTGIGLIELYETR